MSSLSGLSLWCTSVPFRVFHGLIAACMLYFLIVLATASDMCFTIYIRSHNQWACRDRLRAVTYLFSVKGKVTYDDLGERTRIKVCVLVKKRDFVEIKDKIKC